MNYSEIKTIDIANGPGTRTSIFVSGCRRHCRNCFNPETWSFDAGEPYTDETQEYILSTIEPDYVKGMTLLGGEPMEPENQPHIASLIRQFRTRFGKTKTLWMFSGFTFEELSDPNHPVRTEHTDYILSELDVLVDGPYEESLHNVALRFRGSSNQRVLDVPATLKAQALSPNASPVFWEDDPIFASHERDQIQKMKEMALECDNSAKTDI